MIDSPRYRLRMFMRTAIEETDGDRDAAIREFNAMLNTGDEELDAESAELLEWLGGTNERRREAAIELWTEAVIDGTRPKDHRIV
jgi:hypothetical protein